MVRSRFNGNSLMRGNLDGELVYHLGVLDILIS